jgi:hypothetical protein
MDSDREERDINLRLGEAYGAAELKRQEYRSLCFWASLTSWVGIPVSLVVSITTSLALGL